VLASSDTAVLHLLSHLLQLVLQLLNTHFQLLIAIRSQVLLLLLGLFRVSCLVDVKLLPGYPVKGLTERLLTTVSFVWLPSLERYWFSNLCGRMGRVGDIVSDLFAQMAIFSVV
jgi:hypothetical protein